MHSQEPKQEAKEWLVCIVLCKVKSMVYALILCSLDFILFV